MGIVPDFILTLASFQRPNQELNQKFPQATITVLAEKRNAGVFALIPGVIKVLRYDVLTELTA